MFYGWNCWNGPCYSCSPPHSLRFCEFLLLVIRICVCSFEIALSPRRSNLTIQALIKSNGIRWYSTWWLGTNRLRIELCQDFVKWSHGYRSHKCLYVFCPIWWTRFNSHISRNRCDCSWGVSRAHSIRTDKKESMMWASTYDNNLAQHLNISIRCMSVHSLWCYLFVRWENGSDNILWN